MQPEPFELPSPISTCLSTSFLSSCSLMSKIVSHSDNKLRDASLPNTLWSPPEVLQPQPRHNSFNGDATAKLAQKYYQEQWLLVLSIHELSRVIVSNTRAYIRYGLHELCYSCKASPQTLCRSGCGHTRLGEAPALHP